MTKKTGVILSFKFDDSPRENQPKLRIKIDSKGFPYIILNNQKIVMSKTDFPFYYNGVLICIKKGTFDIVEGQTVDKLSVSQIVRVA